MEEKIDVRIERRLVGRKPYEYEHLRDPTLLESDSGFGDAGAKLDPRTGALMYDKYADTVTKTKIITDDLPPEPEPQVELKPPVKYEGIKFSTDSMAMINIKESEEVILSPTGKLKDHSMVGTISVQNLSDDDRLWDIFVKLRDENGVAKLDFDSIKVRELEPRNKVSKKYEIDQINPSLYLEETISTQPDYPESSIFVKDQASHVKFELELKNLSNIPYENVVVRKALPDNLKKIILPEKGEDYVKLEDDLLVWKIPIIMPGDSQVLNFDGDMLPDGLDGASTGEIIVEATGKDTITNFVFTDYDAMCRNMYFIEADETDESEKWLCNFICENTSSFEVEVLRVEVRDSYLDKVYMDLLEPGINVLPKNRWESQPWYVFSKNRPTFIKTLVFNVLPGLTQEMHFKLTKEGDIFSEAGLEFRKTFDKSEVVAGRVTNVNVEIEIKNVGSAAMEQIAVRDLLPKFMTPPTSYKIMRGSEQIVENVNIFIQPEDGAEAVNQQLSFFIKDLSQYGGALAKDETIMITYESRIIKPVPDSKIVAFVEVDGKPYLPGPMISGDAKGRLPAIETRQILRKFSIGKSIEQGTDVGEYNIGILYKNRGNEPIQDLIIKDILPKNFTGVDYSLEPEQVPLPEQGTVLIWLVPRLDDGETTTILYKIKGEGEYHPTDAQVFYNTGGKLGALATKTEIMEEASEVEAPTPPTEPEDEDSEKAVDRPIEDYKTEEDYEPEESEPEE
jgi:uncharacterized repeat protein (TIGR01451 family)